MNRWPLILFSGKLLFLLSCIEAFQSQHGLLHQHNRHRTNLENNDMNVVRMVADKKGEEASNIKPGSPTSTDPSLGVKAAWYSTEIFGEIASVFSGKKQPLTSSSDMLLKSKPLDRDTALSYLKEDYDNDYFVTGRMNLDLYEDDCEFADPFVSFRGLDRFKKNLDNLGAFMEDVNIDIYDWQENENAVQTRWRFKCVLGLPWRPILACKGGTDHYFSESGRIERHVENWEIEPIDALKQLVKPNPKFRA